MKTVIVTIPADQITDRESFHSVFQKALGFLEGYGRNMDAWIDCMGNLDSPSGGMTAITVDEGDLVSLRIDNAEEFQKRCPEQYADLIECVAFVNRRRTDVSLPPILALVLA